MRNATAIGGAGGAIALGLIDLLIRKGILDRAEARQVLSAAQRRIANVGGQDAIEGARIVGEMYDALCKDG